MMDSIAGHPILVADDDSDVLDFLSSTLSRAGYDVQSANGAAPAMKCLDGRAFALVLTDLRMPQASGLDVIKYAQGLSPLTVGVIISGHGTVESALQALRAGAYDYLLKPCPADVLLATVQRALEYFDLKNDLLRKTSQVEQLEGQLQNKDRLLHDFSHELRNPLSVVYGYSSLLLRKPDAHKPEELQRSLKSIQSNAQRLNLLLNDLQDTSQIDSDARLTREPLCAARLAGESVENHRLDAQRRGVALSIEAAAAGLTVDADYGKAHQILSNLIGNALKFTPAGGSVRISADRYGDHARFCVRDTGKGIPAADLDMIFDRFYQAEAEHRKQGLGLGLAISRKFVEMHGGKIWAESSPGQGSAFYFTLPLDTVTAPAN
ncbi:MAG: hybrid sensor histidine kinase/response regulator [Elusimicrobiota bacterium]|jgi:signal transduction histidine kinase